MVLHVWMQCIKLFVVCMRLHYKRLTCKWYIWQTNMQTQTKS